MALDFAKISTVLSYLLCINKFSLQIAREVPLIFLTLPKSVFGTKSIGILETQALVSLSVGVIAGLTPQSRENRKILYFEFCLAQVFSSTEFMSFPLLFLPEPISHHQLKSLHAGTNRLWKCLELGGVELKYFRLKGQKYFVWKIMNIDFFFLPQPSGYINKINIYKIRVTGFKLWQPVLPAWM